MSNDAARPSPEFLATIQPIVLVGGKSTRFGRDKLREPIDDSGELLVQRPINALRAVFGPRVKLVGECHPAITPLADGVIPDEFPGVGPMGGILSALRVWAGPIFVLAGDMPEFDSQSVREIVAAAESDLFAIAIIARSDRTHPCAGVYTQSAGPLLHAKLLARDLRLGFAIPNEHVRPVMINAAKTVNLNRQEQLSSWMMSPQHSDATAPHVGGASRSVDPR